MKIPDIEAIIKLAHEKGIIAICDNTSQALMSSVPRLGRRSGAESATKFIGRP
jgi:cystathionine beta-lyase/cystathionine gamma-synthase